MESGNQHDLDVTFRLHINESKSEGINMLYERELIMMDKAHSVTAIRAKLVVIEGKRQWELLIKVKGENEPLTLVNTRKSSVRRFLREKTLVDYVTKFCPNTSAFVIETQLPKGSSA